MIIQKLLIVFTLLFLLTNNANTQVKSSDIISGEIRTFKSEILGETRSIQIVLPSGYNENITRYPVLLVLDGGSNFRLTSEIVRYLSTNSIIPEIILIGISSPDRNKDFIPSLKNDSNTKRERSGEADIFLKFIENELIPYIDKNFRTINYRAIIGHSLAGLFVLHSFFTKPDIFSGYIASSPSLWWNNEEYLHKPSEYYIQNISLNKNLYVSLANESEDKPDFYTKLENGFTLNRPKGLTVNVKFYKDKNHITSLVESSLDGITSIFSSWMMPMEKIFVANADSIRIFYENLKKDLNNDIKPSPSFLNFAGYQKLRMRDTKTAIEIFRYCVELYPQSANAFDSLAEAYMLSDNKELAIKNYNKSLELNPNNTNAVEQLKKLRAN